MVEINFGTYVKYLKLINSVFYCFPFIILILFIAAECSFTTFNRGLGFYDKTSDKSKDKLFLFLVGFSCLYLIFNALKYISLAVGI